MPWLGSRDPRDGPGQGPSPPLQERFATRGSTRRPVRGRIRRRWRRHTPGSRPRGAIQSSASNSSSSPGSPWGDSLASHMTDQWMWSSLSSRVHAARRRVRQWYPLRACPLLLSRVLREARHTRVQLRQYSIAEFYGSIVIVVKPASALRTCATTVMCGQLSFARM